MAAKKYPLINQIVQNDGYVDNCLSEINTEEFPPKRAVHLELVPNQGDFALKELNSAKKILTNMKWFPNEDVVSLDISELNYTKKQRGKKPMQRKREIQFNLIRR